MGRRGRILLVDDQALTRSPVEIYLRRQGFEPVVCKNGKEALAAAADCPPACILMDLAMPGMDGLEATRQLRAAEATRDIPIIVVTSHPEPHAARAAGATDFLLKGTYTLQELTERIERLVS